MAHCVKFFLIPFLKIYNKLNKPTSDARWMSHVMEKIALPTALPTPTLTITTVPSGESWGVVAVAEAQIYAKPEFQGAPTQKLARLTLLAFEKKSNNGWYMLFGGNGWINVSQIKIYPSEQSANDAIAQLRSQTLSTPAPPKP